ncbi:hypothetical protein QAD02_008893 [Eretmocerus hayati]|uniref:Uncharacterized protein n=1 Tax=Eretmocerus hayati TaxID=131215 RepID=A0ACC2N8K8_9HYME|nr:hypothetical protein QAD02_008893 [Eretmocerus hayati]
MDQIKLYSQLKQAVSLGQKEKIESLLLKGSPINGYSGVCGFRSPLLSSVYFGDVEITKLLLDRGASLYGQHFNNDTALTIAAKIEKYDILDLLLSVKELKNCCNCDKFSHLHIACMRNNVEVVKKLIQSKQDINAAIDNQSLHWPGFTPMHFAVQYRCTETVEYLLSIGADITIKDARQLTPLHLAHMQRSEQIIDMILQAHLNVVSNPANSQSLSHFHIACTRNNPKIVEFFIKIGADVLETVTTNNAVFNYLTAMDLAIYYECVDVVRLLLLHGSHVKSSLDREHDRIEDAYDTGNMELLAALQTRCKFSGDRCPEIKVMSDLHVACIYDDMKLIESFLSENPKSLNSLLWNQCTPLHLAVQHKHRKIIRLLVEQGASFSIKNDRGETSLHLAFESDMDLVNLILENRGEIEQDPADNNGLSHLHIFCASSAINKTNPRIIHDFLDLGSDVNSAVNMDSQFYPGSTPLHFAAKFQCDKIVPILLSRGACYSAVDQSGISIFDLCIKKMFNSYVDENQTVSIMEMILSFHNKHNFSNLDNYGYSLLHVLSYKRDTKLKTLKDTIKKHPIDIKKIVAKVDSPYDGYTPLHFAIKFGNNRSANLLISEGADILCKAANGDTPLHLAFDIERAMEIPMSLQDPDILKSNPVGSRGFSLFHVACGMGSIETMKNFIIHGADVNLPTISLYPAFHDRKPLHLAIQQDSDKSVGAVKLLIENGANVHARDLKMRTPLHFMSDNKRAEIIDILMSQGADINALNGNLETPILRASIDAACMDDEAINANITSLLNYGADINIADEKDHTLLTACAWEMQSDEYCNTIDTLLKHVLRIEMIGHPISETNKEGYFELLELYRDKLVLNESKFKDLCSKESERMDETPITNHTTLRDILDKDLNGLAVISKSDIFVQIVTADDFLVNFPIYGPMLSAQLRKGRARRPLLTNAHKALNFLTKVSLPYVCTELIFQSFSNQDLHSVIVSKERWNTL